MKRKKTYLCSGINQKSKYYAKRQERNKTKACEDEQRQ